MLLSLYNKNYQQINQGNKKIEMDNYLKSSKKSQQDQKTKSRSKNKTNSSAKKKSHYSNQDSATSQNTKKKLIDFILKTAQSQRKLQIIKQALAEVPAFTPASLFHRFDAERKKYIVESDVQDFLIESQINFKGSQLKTLFGRIDVNQSQRIGLRQFQNFILPNQDPKLRYDTMRRPVFIGKPHQKLAKQIEYFTGKLFSQIIKQYSQLAQINSTLKSSYDFNSQNIFKLLSNGTDAITGETLKIFLQQNGEQITDEQIGCLIKTIDKNGVAKISSQDFDFFLATMGLKKTHQVFDELSPIPALKVFSSNEAKYSNEDRESKLKQRYKDNKSYVKGMDSQAHHIPGYSRVLDPQVNLARSWMRQ